MTIATVPATLLTLEPIKDAIRDVLIADLSAALIRVQPSTGPHFDMDEVPEDAISLETYNRIGQVARFPSIVIAGWDVRPNAVSEQYIAGSWRGRIDLSVFVNEANRDRLSRKLDRYMAAIWLCLANTRMYAGAEIDHETFAMGQTPPLGPGAATRAGAAVFDVTFYT